MKPSTKLTLILVTLLLPACLLNGSYAQKGIALSGAELTSQLATVNGTTRTISLDGFVKDHINKVDLKGISAPATAPAVLWTSDYGDGGKNECYAVKQTSDGGYVMIGRSDYYGAGNFDGWMVKTDADGNVEWTKTYGDSYIDEAYMVKELSAGGYIIAGMSTAFGWAGEGWLVRTDAQGNVIWSHGYHPSAATIQAAWDYLYDVVEMSDGGFTAVGVGNDDYMSMQAWIMRTDADGNMLWDHMYGGEYWERLFGLDKTSDGTVVAVGDRHWTYDSISWRHDGWLLKFTETGDTAWTKHFGSTGHDIFRSVKQTTSGGYIICGERMQDENDSFHGWLLRTDANGTAMWNRTLATGGLYTVSQVANGCFAAAGIYFPAGIACQGWLLKADGAGNIQWESYIEGTDLDDMFLGMQPTADGGYILGGKYNSDGGTCNYWLVRTDAEPMEPLTYFYENYDAVTQPALPDGWTALVQKMLSNTIAEVKTMEMGSTTSLPNAVFIMNGLDGNNGQLDTTAFVSLVTPWVLVGPTGATLTFRANGGCALQVGTLSDPLDPSTFTLVEEIMPDFNFSEHTVSFMTPGTAWIALKHSNTSTVMPVFIDDAEFKQIINVGTPETGGIALRIYPNPAADRLTVEAAEPMSAVTVYTILGSQVCNVNAGDVKKLMLDLSTFRPGPYVVRIATSDGSVVSRLVTVTK